MLTGLTDSVTQRRKQRHLCYHFSEENTQTRVGNATENYNFRSVTDGGTTRIQIIPPYLLFICDYLWSSTMFLRASWTRSFCEFLAEGRMGLLKWIESLPDGIFCWVYIITNCLNRRQFIYFLINCQLF